MYLKIDNVCAIGLLIIGSGFATAAPIPSQSMEHVLDLRGSGPDQLVLPSDVVTLKGKVFVVDGGNHRVQVFNENGKFAYSIGRRGTGPGEFDSPVGISKDDNGNIVVADTGNHRIQILSSTGKSKKVVKLKYQDKPVRPIDVAIHPKNGNLYVTGNHSHRVLIFQQNGKLLKSWGGNGADPGEFRYPATIELLSKNRVAVVDVLNTRVQLFNADGNFLVNIGKWGVLPGQLFRPKGISIDKDQRVYVSDSYLNLIQVFDDGGHFLHVLKPTSDKFKLKSPAGIHVAKNKIYISEMLAHKVSVFKLK